MQSSIELFKKLKVQLAPIASGQFLAAMQSAIDTIQAQSQWKEFDTALDVAGFLGVDYKTVWRYMKQFPKSFEKSGLKISILLPFWAGLCKKNLW